MELLAFFMLSYLFPWRLPKILLGRLEVVNENINNELSLAMHFSSLPWAIPVVIAHTWSYLRQAGIWGLSVDFAQLKVIHAICRDEALWN